MRIILKNKALNHYKSDNFCHRLTIFVTHTLQDYKDQVQCQKQLPFFPLLAYSEKNKLNRTPFYE